MPSRGGPLSAEHKAKISAALKGRPKPPVSDTARAKMRAAKLGKPGPWLGKKRGPLTPEWARKIGAAGKGRPCAYARRVTYNGISFRSAWEVRVAKALDALGVQWEYEPKRFEIDSTTTFLPDFYLPDAGAFWEVKGWYDDFSRIRVEGFRERYPDVPLVLVTRPALSILEATARQ